MLPTNSAMMIELMTPPQPHHRFRDVVVGEQRLQDPLTLSTLRL